MTIASRVYAKARASSNGNGVYSSGVAAFETSLAKASPNESGLRVVTLSEVTPEEVQWLWPGRIALGKLAVLEGDPGVGKSILTIAVAAHVTSGVLLPDTASADPADVLFITYEDGLGDTVLPRLTAAGGDSHRFHVVDCVEPCAGSVERPLTVPEDVERLRIEIKKYGAKLVVIDPLGAALSSNIDAHKDAEVRRALASLSNVAAESGVAIVVVRHFPKRASGRAITAGAGSIGITGAARGVLALHQDPGDSTKRVLAVAKCNLALLAPSLRFRFEQHGNGVPRICWEGESSLSADDLILSRAAAPDVREDEASAFLKQRLEKSPRLASQLLKEAQAEGISRGRLERAKKKLRVRHFRERFGGLYVWELPNAISSVVQSFEDNAEPKDRLHRADSECGRV